MSKYTPGPWAIVETTDPVVLSFWHIKVGAHQLPFFPYKCIYSADRTQSGFVGDPEMHANANLIAAAPELLEALEALLALNENYSAFGGEIHRDRIDRAWDNARAALAKARGEK